MSSPALAKQNAKKLGKSFGAAGTELKKHLLFHFAKKLGMDVCYRCGEKIVDIAKFSVEHKKGWRFAENPKETFFDLDNIAFSHLSCNSRAKKHHRKYSSREEAREAKAIEKANWYTKNREIVIKRRRQRYHNKVNARVVELVDT